MHKRNSPGTFELLRTRRDEEKLFTIHIFEINVSKLNCFYYLSCQNTKLDNVQIAEYLGFTVAC